MSDLIKLGGLWVNKDKNGRQYLAGKLSSTVRILIFKNEYKSADNQPAYQMYLAPVDPVPGEDNRGQNDEFLPDDLGTVDTEEAPAPRPVAARPTAPPPSSRPQSPASRPPARPAPATAPTRPAPRRPEPAAQDFEELDDPFAE